MVTIQQISKLSNCSISTVSKALNGYSDISENTRKKIIEIADQLGYVPNATAQSLVRKRSNTIGLVYNVEYGLMNLFFTSILETFRKHVELRGYDLLLLSNNTENGIDYLRHCRSKHVDAVLVVSVGSDIEGLKKLRESEIAVLTLDPEVDLNNSIYSDSYSGIQMACEYLYELGHKKVSFIQGDKTNFVGRKRLDGYLDFMNDHQLEPIYFEPLNNITYSYEEGYNTMQIIHEQYGLPEAVVASSDLMAAGAMAYIQDQGYKVPDDVSVIGFDDIHLCEIVTPKLTTIRQNYDLIGQKACEVLLNMVETKKENKEPMVLDTSLVIRDSCKRRV